MKITIAGAGAMGSRFGLMLHKAGNEVVLVDGWPEHVEAINRDGLKANFNGKDIVEHIPAVLQSDIPTDFKTDLIILFTKALQLDDMMQALKPVIHDKTNVLCLLNGIGHEEIIEKYVGLENIFIGNTMWTAGLEGPGKAKLFGTGSVELENLGEGQSEKAKEIAKVLTEAGLNASYSDNIRYSIYRKACVNGTLNGLCTILDCNITGFGTCKYAHEIVTTIVSEFAAVAKHENVTLDVAEVIQHIEETYDPETIGLHYPSMYQDLIKNHRLTEIDFINGAVANKGEKYGISTPYCKFLTELIHCKEEILKAK